MAFAVSVFKPQNSVFIPQLRNVQTEIQERYL